MKINTLLITVSVFALFGCGPSDVGQTTGTGPTVEDKIADIEKSPAPREVKDRAIADLRAHEAAYKSPKK